MIFKRQVATSSPITSPSGKFVQFGGARTQDGSEYLSPKRGIDLTPRTSPPGELIMPITPISKLLKKVNAPKFKVNEKWAASVRSQIGDALLGASQAGENLKQLGRLRIDLESAKSEITLLGRQRDAAEAATLKSESETAGLRAEVKRLSRLVELKSKELEEAVAQNARLEHGKERLIKGLEAVGAERDRYLVLSEQAAKSTVLDDIALRAPEAKILQLEQDLRESNALLGGLTHELSELKATINQLKVKMAEDTRFHLEQQSQSTLEISELEGDRDNAQQKLTVAESRLARQGVELDRYKTERDTLVDVFRMLNLTSDMIDALVTQEGFPVQLGHDLRGTDAPPAGYGHVNTLVFNSGDRTLGEASAAVPSATRTEADGVGGRGVRFGRGGRGGSKLGRSAASSVLVDADASVIDSSEKK